jgi:hypothetical protein
MPTKALACMQSAAHVVGHDRIGRCDHSSVGLVISNGGAVAGDALFITAQHIDSKNSVVASTAIKHTY